MGFSRCEFKLMKKEFEEFHNFPISRKKKVNPIYPIHHGRDMKKLAID